MKRFLLAAFAAAVTVAWAVPSTAADVNVGLQYRLRGEMMNNVDFNDNVNDHADAWGQRVRVSVNAKADDVSAKVTIQETRTWGTENDGNLTANNFSSDAIGGGAAAAPVGKALDVHEAYINVANIAGAPVSAKIGRQELNYGDQRLLGGFGWSNRGRAFDAIKFGYKSDMVDVDAFTAKITENGTTGRDTDLWGLYAMIRPVPDKLADIDVYLLRRTNGAVAPITSAAGTQVAPSDLNTIGVRINGAVAGADYTAEIVPYQSGTTPVASGANTQNDIKSEGLAYAIKAGYTIPGVEQKVRVGFEYDYASGNDSTDPKKNKTFNQLYPTNHDKYGIADRQGWRNVKAWSLNASAVPVSNLKVGVAYWNFSLATEKDSWYNAAGVATAWAPATAGAAAPTAVGSEIDVTASYKVSGALDIDLGYATFMPGDFTKKNATFGAAGSTAKVANESWMYLQLTSNF